MAITPDSRTPVHVPSEPPRRSRWWVLDRPITARMLIRVAAPLAAGSGVWAVLPEAWATPVTVGVVVAAVTFFAARPKR